MELTVEVSREENHHYTAEVLGPGTSGLEGLITETRALSDLADALEEAIRMVLDDDSFRFVDPRLALGTNRVRATGEGREAG